MKKKGKHFMTVMAKQLTPKQSACKFNQHAFFCCHAGNSDIRSKKHRIRQSKALSMPRCMEQFCPFFYDIFIKENAKTDEEMLMEELKKNDKKNKEFKQWEEEWEKSKIKALSNEKWHAHYLITKAKKAKAKQAKKAKAKKAKAKKAQATSK